MSRVKWEKAKCLVEIGNKKDPSIQGEYSDVMTALLTGTGMDDG
jgi:hypothetical protein